MSSVLILRVRSPFPLHLDEHLKISTALLCLHDEVLLTHKATTVADSILIFYFYFSEKIRLGISWESSALKFQVLFSLEYDKEEK